MTDCIQRVPEKKKLKDSYFFLNHGWLAEQIFVEKRE